MSEYKPHDIMKHFDYEHLPEPLRAVSKMFHATASWVDQNIEGCAEKTVALRKILEAKDAAVRARREETLKTT